MQCSNEKHNILYYDTIAIYIIHPNFTDLLHGHLKSTLNNSITEKVRRNSLEQY